MDASKELASLTHVPGTEHQAGALAWRIFEGDWQCVIVTSRRTGRWVLPKGTIEPGMTQPETALREASEEAGITGTVGARPVGHYEDFKIRPPEYWKLRVAVYAVRITAVADTWLEQGERQRRFVTAREAAALLENPGMARLVRNFAPRPIPD